MTKVSDLDKQFQKFSKDFAVKSAKIDEVSTNLEESREKIGTIIQNLAANQAVTDSLSRAVESSNLKMQSLVDQMDLFKAESEEKENRRLDPKNNGFAEISEKLTFATERLEAFKNEIARVNESIFLLQSEDRDISKKMEEHDDLIASARSKVDSLASDTLPALTRQLEKFENDFHSWGEKISAISQSVDGITPKLEAFRNNHDDNGLSEKLITISQRLDALEKNISESNSRIGEIQGNVASLAKRQQPVEVQAILGPIDLLDGEF